MVPSLLSGRASQSAALRQPTPYSSSRGFVKTAFPQPGPEAQYEVCGAATTGNLYFFFFFAAVIILFMYLFLVGAGSSLLCGLFSSCSK